MKQLLERLWAFKLKMIREYPVACAIIAWLEGIVIGIIIYHYFFQVRYSCCVELG